MLMSVVAHPYDFVDFAKLSGSRLLLTGLTSQSGFDLARAFADHGAQLIVQSPEDGPEMTELAAVLAENAGAIKLFTTPLETEEQAARLVQGAVQDFGGIDTVVNLVTIDTAAVARLETLDDVQALVNEALRIPLALTQVAANRMRLVWTEGSILNVVRLPQLSGGPAMMLADVLRAELQDLTRGLAAQWADQGIRINAIGPPSSMAARDGRSGGSDADLAAIALRIASRKGRSVSGHVLDAEGAAQRGC